MEEDIYMDRMSEAMMQIDLKNLAFQSDIQLREELKAGLLQDPAFLEQAAQVIAAMQEEEAGPGGVEGVGQAPPPQGPGAQTGQVGGQGQNNQAPDLGIPSETGGANEAVPAEFSPQASQELQEGGGSEPAFS